MPHLARDMRVPILIAIVHIPDTVILCIPLRALHTIQKPATFKFTELLRRRIPRP